MKINEYNTVGLISNKNVFHMSGDKNSLYRSMNKIKTLVHTARFKFQIDRIYVPNYILSTFIISLKKRLEEIIKIKKPHQHQ